MANKKLPRITQIPAAFQPVMDAFNEAMESIEGSVNLTSNDKSVSITTADGNTDLSASGGAGLPPDYTFEEFTICDSGEPATRWWPTWTTNPEA